jgi:hypothetical protein
MRKTRNAKLNLLSLESRLTPAVTAKLSGGSLNVNGDDTDHTIYIFHKAGGVTDVRVAPTFFTNAAGQALVQEGLLPLLASFTVTKDIRVRDGNGHTAVVVTIDDGVTAPGKIEINTGSGDNQIQLQTRNNGFADVAGTINIKPGNGTNDIWIFDIHALGRVNVTGTYAGARNVFQTSHSHYEQTVTAANSVVLIDHQFGGNVFESDLRVRQSITVSIPGNYQNMDGLAYPEGAKVGDPGVYHGLLVIDGTVTGTDADNHIKGNVSFHGSKARDGVYISGKIDGNVRISGNGGTDDFFIGETRTNPAPYASIAQVGGNVRVRGGADADHLSISAGTTVGLDILIDLNNGDNTYDLDQVFAATGKFSLRATHGNDLVGAIAGSAASFKVDLGHGTNSVEFSGSGGAIDYRSGNGNDSVILSGSYASLKGRWSGGDDLFVNAASGVLGVGGFNGDFGAGINDTYDGSAVAESWPVVTKNCEIVL